MTTAPPRPPVDRQETRTRTHLACRNKSDGELENDRAVDGDALADLRAGVQSARPLQDRIWGPNVDDSLDPASLEPVAE